MLLCGLSATSARAFGFMSPSSEMSTDPATELIRAAQIDGAGFFRIFWRILLPSSGPIIVVTVIWQFTNIWNDFLFGASFADVDSMPMTVAPTTPVEAASRAPTRITE